MVPRRVILLLALASLASATMAAESGSLDAQLGQRLFQRNWVSAPSSTGSDDGLGPIYDARSCAACHPNGGSSGTGTVIRLGNARGEGDPVYGAQLQTRALPGQTPEAEPKIAWQTKDGRRVAAIVPEHLGYGPLAKDTRMALRRAPPLFGVGLLAQIPESEILRQARAEKDEGVEGKPAYVTIAGKRALGRFGWKATQPDLIAQTAIALSRDIGLSTTLHPEPWGDCTKAQTACLAGPHGAAKGEVEVPDVLVALIARYLQSISAPQVATSSAEALFRSTGCAACHATLHLADGRAVPAFTDLLLHDLGPGLNDGIAEGAAGAGEWRTSPLWNVAASLKAGGLLHDGRARDVKEAVAWHDGEARAIRQRFEALSAAEQAELVAFVSGL
jgi:CxxC motif-containing protein (DUF1111 family)